MWDSKHRNYGDPDVELILDLLILLAVSLVAGLIAKQIQLPIVFGYVLAGIVLGPSTPGLNVTRSLDPGLMLEIGVALLLFTIGVEFSLKLVQQVPKIALLGTPIQMVLTSLYGFGVGSLLGWEWRIALWFGVLASLSSTLIVQQSLLARQIPKGETRQVMAAILIIQNLVIVPLAFLLTILHESGITADSVALAVIEGALFLAILLFFGAQVLPRLLNWLTTESSQELRALSILAIVAIITYTTYLLGLPFLLAAFAVGLALSESDLGRQTLTEVLRIRAIFGFLFFTAAGMLLDIQFLATQMGVILLIVLLLFVGKGAILMLVTYIAGHRQSIPLRVGMGLAPVGELSLALAWLGWTNGILTEEIYLLLLSSGLLTILLVPILIRLSSPFSRQIEGSRVV
jgi:CPA2 family monovalent cation:H+ antiporter-2